MNLVSHNLAQLTSDLVKINSVSGNEQHVAEFISNWLKGHGVQSLLIDRCVLGRVVGKDSSRALILNGHIDTVGTGDESSWQKSPNSGLIDKEYVYGLGASDMKAGVASMMLLVEYYGSKASKNKPPVDIIFTFVCEEETTGHGTKSALKYLQKQKWFKDYKQVEAILGEPTNNGYVGIGHRGNQFVKVKIAGDSGHASLPDKINSNVLTVLDEIIVQIDLLQKKWDKQYLHPQLGKPTIAVTQIFSGDVAAPNKIAGNCDLTLDIRTTPDLHEKLKQELKVLTEVNFGGDITLEFGSGEPVGYCSPESKLRQLFDIKYPDLPQHPIQGAADLCIFTNQAIPAVIFGPGQRDKMHAANESVNIQSLVDYRKIMEDVVEEYAHA